MGGFSVGGGVYPYYYSSSAPTKKGVGGVRGAGEYGTFKFPLYIYHNVRDP